MWGRAHGRVQPPNWKLRFTFLHPLVSITPRQAFSMSVIPADNVNEGAEHVMPIDLLNWRSVSWSGSTGLS